MTRATRRDSYSSLRRIRSSQPRVQQQLRNDGASNEDLLQSAAQADVQRLDVVQLGMPVPCLDGPQQKSDALDPMNGMSPFFLSHSLRYVTRDSKHENRGPHLSIAAYGALFAFLAFAPAACDADRQSAADSPAAEAADSTLASVAYDTSPAEDTNRAGVDSSGPSRELLMALRDLVDGVEDEPSRQTWFSKATANSIRVVDIDSMGHAIVDFYDLTTVIPNASSSAGSAMLLQELDSTVFSVPDVKSVEYRIMGSCVRFWEWLQYSCRIVERDQTP